MAFSMKPTTIGYLHLWKPPYGLWNIGDPYRHLDICYFCSLKYHRCWLYNILTCWKQSFELKLGFRCCVPFDFFSMSVTCAINARSLALKGKTWNILVILPCDQHMKQICLMRMLTPVTEHPFGWDLLELSGHRFVLFIGSITCHMSQRCSIKTKEI